MGSPPVAVLAMSYSLHTVLPFLITRWEHHGAGGSKTIYPISAGLKYNTVWHEDICVKSMDVLAGLYIIALHLLLCLKTNTPTPDLWGARTFEFYKFELRDEETMREYTMRSGWPSAAAVRQDWTNETVCFCGHWWETSTYRQRWITEDFGANLHPKKKQVSNTSERRAPSPLHPQLATNQKFKTEGSSVYILCNTISG